MDKISKLPSPQASQVSRISLSRMVAFVRARSPRVIVRTMGCSLWNMAHTMVWSAPFRIVSPLEFVADSSVGGQTQCERQKTLYRSIPVSRLPRARFEGVARDGDDATCRVSKHLHRRAEESLLSRFVRVHACRRLNPHPPRGEKSDYKRSPLPFSAGEQTEAACLSIKTDLVSRGLVNFPQLFLLAS